MDESGELMDTFMLEKTAKLLRVDNNIKIAGVLIPNSESEKAPRIQELKGIVTEPDDAIKADFSANLDNIADLLTWRVKRLVGCLGKNLSVNSQGTLSAYLGKIADLVLIRVKGLFWYYGKNLC